MLIVHDELIIMLVLMILAMLIEKKLTRAIIIHGQICIVSGDGGVRHKVRTRKVEKWTRTCCGRGDVVVVALVDAEKEGLGLTGRRNWFVQDFTVFCNYEKNKNVSIE